MVASLENALGRSASERRKAQFGLGDALRQFGRSDRTYRDDGARGRRAHTIHPQRPHMHRQSSVDAHGRVPRRHGRHAH
jgi:hypothetical protein